MAEFADRHSSEDRHLRQRYNSLPLISDDHVMPNQLRHCRSVAGDLSTL
jgi:hypothetical protein